MGKRHDACSSVSDKLDRAGIFWQQDRRADMMTWVDSSESNMILRLTPTPNAGRGTREDISIDGRRAFVFHAWLRVAAHFAEQRESLVDVMPQRADGQRILWRSYRLSSATENVRSTADVLIVNMNAPPKNWNIFRFPTKAVDKRDAAAFARFCHKNLPLSTLLFVHDGDHVQKITVGPLESSCCPAICDTLEEMTMEVEELGDSINCKEHSTRRKPKRSRPSAPANLQEPASPIDHASLLPCDATKHTPRTSKILECYQSLKDSVRSFLH